MACDMELVDGMEQCLLSIRDNQYRQTDMTRKRNVWAQLSRTELKKSKSTIETLNIESEVEKERHR